MSPEVYADLPRIISSLSSVTAKLVTRRLNGMRLDGQRALNLQFDKMEPANR